MLVKCLRKAESACPLQKEVLRKQDGSLQGFRGSFGGPAPTMPRLEDPLSFDAGQRHPQPVIRVLVARTKSLNCVLDLTKMGKPLVRFTRTDFESRAAKGELDDITDDVPDVISVWLSLAQIVTAACFSGCEYLSTTTRKSFAPNLRCYSFNFVPRLFICPTFLDVVRHM